VAVERAWAPWNDPRQLERWWGAPTYPATVVEDGFGDGAGHAAAGMPTTTMTVELAAGPSGRTTMTLRTVFPSLEAMGQIDDILAAHATR
jgi:uncharacterized protein YndB with AHSA1/START domain